MGINIDIRENDILQQSPELLETLLIDHSRPKEEKKHGHIIWATDNYEFLGDAYKENAFITIELITGDNGNIIQPRICKTEEEKQRRVRDKGEVFTPSWICNSQNNLIDNEWFGEANVFNKETDKGWETNLKPITFPTKDGKSWQNYVKDTRLEITCGEAPYLMSRYDTITGDPIPVENRIGLLDRKLRIVNENTNNLNDWFEWAKIAFKSTYAYEWQGDNLLLARENALYTFSDYFFAKFNETPSLEMAREVAEIISWNFWQMDGLRGVIPNSCRSRMQNDLFTETEIIGCKGCQQENLLNGNHYADYCLIKDWNTSKTIRFIDLIKR